MSDYLRYHDDDHRSPTGEHDELTADLVYASTEYFRALASGEANRLITARANLNRIARYYYESYGNPCDVIDINDPKVIAAHSDLVADIAFNAHADDVYAAFNRVIDLDNDRIADRGDSPWVKTLNRNNIDRAQSAYKDAYPTAPTPEGLAYIRRTLTPRVIS